MPGLICSCSDFHCGTGARNRVSSGRKRRFPPRGTDKDLINGSESRPFWPGARALRSGIAEWEETEPGSWFPGAATPSASLAPPGLERAREL